MAFLGRQLGRTMHRHLNTFKLPSVSSKQPSHPFFRPSFKPSSSPAARFRLNARQTRSYGNGAGQSESILDKNDRLLWGLLGANTAVFFVQYAPPEHFQWLKQQISSHFVLNMHAIQEHKYYTLLTSAFNHGNLFHLLGNLVTMYAFGNHLSAHPGILPSHIVTLVLGSAITCGIASLVNANNKGASPYFSFVGASGVVMGLGAAGAVLDPRARFLIYGIVPAPLWLLLGGYAFYDFYFLDDRNSRVGHAGHLGGLAFGLAFAVTRLGRFRYRL